MGSSPRIQPNPLIYNHPFCLFPRFHFTNFSVKQKPASKQASNFPRRSNHSRPIQRLTSGGARNYCVWSSTLDHCSVRLIGHGAMKSFPIIFPHYLRISCTHKKAWKNVERGGRRSSRFCFLRLGEKEGEKFKVEMKVIGGGSAESGHVPATAPAVVVVGVKFDAESRELLTWALVKAARPGDRVIALHVLDTFTESTSSLLSLVNTFDSMLSVYEGFCNLKQVDLKLKVCRGSSAKKILVKEARSYGAAKVVVGKSKSHHTIRSSASVAKYCSKKLSRKSFGVFAVTNGKVVFQREPTGAEDLQEDRNRTKLPLDANSTEVMGNSHKKYGHCTTMCRVYGGKNAQSCPSVCDSASRAIDDSSSQSLEVFPEEESVDNSLALVPIESTREESGSELIVVGKSTMSKRGWSLLRQMFFSRWLHQEILNAKKKSVMQQVLRLPSNHSSAVIHPDQKQNHSDLEYQSSNLNRENGAIVAVGNDNMLPSVSSCDTFDNLHEELVGLHERYTSTCRLFSYKELLEATSNFAPENVVGKGGSSHVYKGCLADGKELAVKILKPSEHIVKEFVLEIEIITTLSHKNIVSLFGFCYEDCKLILVYDFLSRGNLEENLHAHKKDTNAFGWEKRHKVAVCIAEALAYLHNSCAESVIHGDVKSSNILLSDDFEPQLSDFGLASWGSSGSSHTIGTDVAGTFGYLAPEYFMHGKVSDKIDVYAFGVVLLELLSGRKPIDRECAKGGESLIMWAKPILRDGKISEILDPDVGAPSDFSCIENMVLAATLCLKRSPKLRPQISLVLKILLGDEDATDWGRQLAAASEETDFLDDETSPTNIQSHLNLAFSDLEDDSASVSSNEQTVSIEDYLRGRCSRSSSFDKKC